MKSRERQLAAIRHQLTDRVAIDAIAVENADAIGRRLGIETTGVLPRLGIDGRVVGANYLGEIRPPENAVSYTEWGTPSTGDYGTARADYPLAAATSVKEIEKHEMPDPTRYDFATAAKVARALNAEHAVRGPYWKPVFCRVCDLFGMEEAMMKMMAEPEVFEAAVERVFQYTHAFCERLLDACGDAMPILCLGDDFATQRGMMISPENWRKFLEPRYAKLFALGKSRGKFVWFHSCGDVTAVVPDLIDIGLDVWETVQLHTLPIPAEQLKREYGRDITFFGGVNTQRLPFATPHEVREETLRCIEVLGRDGGYICGPDHHVKPDVPAENVLALFDTAMGFRRTGYTNHLH